MLEGFQRWLMRQTFSGMGGVLGAGTRINIYETLEMLLSNQVKLSVALREIYRVESNDGKKKNEIRAIVLYECMTAMEDGKPLSHALERWIPDQELQLIRAGERSGDMVGVLKDVIRIIDAKSQIFKAVIGGTLYPMVLMGIIACRSLPASCRLISGREPLWYCGLLRIL